MYIIKKDNIINLTRGDYLEFPVNLKIGSFPNYKIYELEEGDLVIFSLMYPNQHFEDGIVKKEFTYQDQDSEGNVYVVLNSEDTVGLLPGTYYYEVKVLYPTADGTPRVDTVVQKTKFNLID